MSIIFTGAAAFEFGNVTSLQTVANTYDPDYAFGAIQRTSINSGYAVAQFYKLPVAQELWVHAKTMLGNSGPDSSYGPIIGLFSQSGVALGGLTAQWATAWNNVIQLSANGGASTGVGAMIPTNTLVDVDLHYFRTGNTMVIELYINGTMVAQHRVSGTWTTPAYLRFGGLEKSSNFFSEVIVTEGDDPTLAWRLHSKRPNPSLPGLNTFDSGFWGSLANNDLSTGVVTRSEGARLTGGFDPYSGPEAPLGIRAVVNTGRLLKNGTLLNLKGQLRINDVNYDTPDFEYSDQSRIMSIWEKNPATDADFEVTDFPGLQSGFYTAL